RLRCSSGRRPFAGRRDRLAAAQPGADRGPGVARAQPPHPQVQRGRLPRAIPPPDARPGPGRPEGTGGMRIAPGQARARVEAHLGRPPQDALEAAVVLEAWGGLRARSALELGTSVLNLSARARGAPGGTAAPPVTPVA